MYIIIIYHQVISLSSTNLVILFASLFSLLCFSTRHNARARHFVPVTLAEWCQLHKDSWPCPEKKRKREKEKYRRVKEGVCLSWRGSSANERKGSYSSEGEVRNREWEREWPERIGWREPSEWGRPMNTEKRTKIEPIPACYRHGTFLRTGYKRGEEVKKVKVCANATR